MSEVFYIVNWPYHEHRDLNRVRHPSWCKGKVDFQGPDWRRLAGHRHAAEGIAAWEIVRGLALLSPFRGLLLTDGHVVRPLDVRMMAEVAGVKERIMARGFERLLPPTDEDPERIGWIGIAEVSERNGKVRPSFPALSRKIWADVFTPGDVANAIFRADGAEKARSHSHSQSQLSSYNSHRKPRAASEEKTAKTSEASKPERSDGEGDGEHGNGHAAGPEDSGLGWPPGSFQSLFAFVDSRVDPRRGVTDPTAWRLAFRQRLPDLIRYDPVRVLATLLDVRFARNKPGNDEELVRRVFWRLNNTGAPSARHHAEAKKALGMSR